MRYKVGNCLINDRLKERHLTQAELAKKTGIPRQQINDFTSNRRVATLGNAKSIADVLKCRIEDLYEFKRE